MSKKNILAVFVAIFIFLSALPNISSANIGQSNIDRQSIESLLDILNGLVKKMQQVNVDYKKSSIKSSIANKPRPDRFAVCEEYTEAIDNKKIDLFKSRHPDFDVSVCDIKPSIPYTPETHCPRLYRNLFLGLEGSDVKELQNFLKQKGYYTYRKITGYFGPATQRAVQRFQAKMGIVSYGDPETTGFGVVGPATRRAMGCGTSTIVINDPVPSPGEDPNCKKWIDANGHEYKRAEYGGTGEPTGIGYDSKCTMTTNGSSCSLPPARCLEYFDVPGVRNQHPTIHSINGLSILHVGEQGIWRINATDPKDRPLTYTVKWGDEGSRSPIDELFKKVSSENANRYIESSEVTFSHTYHRSGEYTIKIIVKNEDGESATASYPVRVINKLDVPNMGNLRAYLMGPEQVELNKKNSWIIKLNKPITNTMRYELYPEEGNPASATGALIKEKTSTYTAKIYATYRTPGEKRMKLSIKDTRNNDKYIVYKGVRVVDYKPGKCVLKSLKENHISKIVTKNNSTSCLVYCNEHIKRSNNYIDAICKFNGNTIQYYDTIYSMPINNQPISYPASREIPLNCKVWQDGCNVCSKEAPNKPAVCTKSVCTFSVVKPAYCKEYFNENRKKSNFLPQNNNNSAQNNGTSTNAVKQLANVLDALKALLDKLSQ